MDADGGNQRLVQSSFSSVAAPSFFKDGTKIVAWIFDFAGLAYLVTVNVDGTGITQVSSGAACSFGYCANPIFTSDDKQIVFGSVLCTPIELTTVCSEQLYIVNTDGSNLTNLPIGGTGDGVISDQPRSVGHGIVFTTNRDHPNTNKFELYNIMPDGSNLTQLTKSNVYTGMTIDWLYY